MSHSLRIVAFDVDGVLLDSYSCLPAIYREIGEIFFSLSGKALELFTNAMIIAEDFNDFHQRYPPSSWWPRYFQALHLDVPQDTIEALSEFYWKERMKRSVLMEGIPFVLDELLQRGYTVAIVCGTDGIPGLKQKRIHHHGIHHHVADIFIATENCDSKLEGLRKLIRKYRIKPSQLAFIDDKPHFLQEARSLGVAAYQLLFEGPLTLAWMRDSSDDLPLFRSLKEILERTCSF